MGPNDECPCCGSFLSHRISHAGSQLDVEGKIPLGPIRCPHCEGQKCCMCDMGDDVPCLNCENQS